MTFNLIGLGMNANSLTLEAIEALKSSDKVFLENYTVDLPYGIEKLHRNINKRLILLERSIVESEEIVDDSKKENISLLVYGDALSATTHLQLILACKQKKVDYKIFHNASVMNVVAETGLQLYKFGKTASMPSWKEHTNKPTSFMKYIKENQSINAHTLLLTDIGLKISDALKQLKESSKKENVKLPKKIVVCSNIGTPKQKIIYESLENLKMKKILLPFCFIIPGDLHFTEEEFLGK
jgi:diphthine synthase